MLNTCLYRKQQNSTSYVVRIFVVCIVEKERDWTLVSTKKLIIITNFMEKKKKTSTKISPSREQRNAVPFCMNIVITTWPWYPIFSSHISKNVPSKLIKNRMLWTTSCTCANPNLNRPTDMSNNLKSWRKIYIFC